MRVRIKKSIPFIITIWVSMMLSGCHAPVNETDPTAGHITKVVATTNIVGDVVAHVGREKIDLTVLMGIGVDPHTYVPTPKDVAAVHDADIVYANGAGLEEFLEEVLENAGGGARVIYLSDGIQLRTFEGPSISEQPQSDNTFLRYDPHVWFSVPNVIHWVKRIESTLSEIDPNEAAAYAANAAAYIADLEELDQWIMEQVSYIPEEHRKLVTNHPAFGYFAERYGLEQIGAVYPISPSSEPSASDLVALEEMIRKFNVPAIFTESTVNPKLAEQVTKDTGIKLVPLYTGSLGAPGSGAESYVELMRYDVNAIVHALSE